MDLIGDGTLAALVFSKHFLGIITHPYQTYRHIIDHGRWGELVYIWIICCAYFALASVVKTASFHPVLLTKQFVVLVGSAILGFSLLLLLLGITGKYLTQKFSFQRVSVAWGYTLIPTVIWFLITSFLYVILPPPRTESFLGVGFSLLYLTLSVILFFWKAELYYLTLRFGLKLDLIKIIAVTAIYVPLLGIFSICMYKLGILRVPFL